MDTNIIDFKKYGKDELIDKLTKIYNELDIMRESEIFKNDDELTFNIEEAMGYINISIDSIAEK